VTDTADEIAALQGEVDALADFLQTLHRELVGLRVDFASVLRALGENVRVAREHVQTPPLSGSIERTEDVAAGTVMFSYRER